jgi:multiple sugar transport system substrate-binding protein
MRKAMRVAAAGATLALTTLGLVACSSTPSSPGGGGGSSSGKIDSSQYGPITVVQGKDNNGTLPLLKAMWDKAHPKTPVTFKQQSDQADQQLQDLLLHFQQKSTDYDVVSSDVVWTQQLASNQYLQPLTGAYKLDESAVVPAVLATSTYHNVQYAAPAATDSQILYYRKDLLGSKPVPTTYDEMFKDCSIAKAKNISCYTGQFAKYEGLTVNAAEAINAAGGQIVKSDGKTPDVNTPAAAKGLDFLVNGFKQGYIPREAIGFQETQSLNAFQAGQLVFMRNWPYADAILNGAGSKVKGKFDIAPLPGPNGHGASSLGGHSLAVSKFSKHQATGAAFVKWMEEPEQQSYDLTKGTLAPVLTSLYSDAALGKQVPYLPVLLKSIQTAVPRPVTPFYPAVTEAIEVNAYAALQGQKSTTQALSDMQKAIASATG